MSMRVAMKFTTLPYSLKCWQSCKLSTRRTNLQRPARNFVMMCDSKFYRGAPTPTKGLLTSARYLSTDPNSNHNHNDGKGTEEDATMKATGWINDFNIILGSNPEMSLHTFIVIRVATWYTAAALFGLVTGMGPELGVGYLAAKFTGKLRQPFNVGLAAILSNQFPSFGTIKASALLGIVKPIPVTDEEQSKKPALQVKLEKALEWLSGPMDKYGFSYFVAGKINLAIVIIGTSYAVKAGLDVPETLKYLGMSESLQTGAGALGAATLTNTLLAPVHVVMLPYMIPAMASFFKEAQEKRDLMRSIADKFRHPK